MKIIQGINMQASYKIYSLDENKSPIKAKRY